jgi:uncharacterized protein
MLPPFTPPPGAAPASDLTDAEFRLLDALLAAAPKPLAPMDAVMLDGYLCGVLVQPRPIDAAAWLPKVFDLDGRPLPDATAQHWRARVEPLVMRRYAALNRAIVDSGWFDPLILEFDDSHPIAVSEYEPLAALPPVSQALSPWVAGFHAALMGFRGLVELDDPALGEALARLLRHMPPELTDALPAAARIDGANPLAGLDAAIDELVAAVVEIADLTHERRYRVETVRRAMPKVGRNERCPCGSGRKYKLCHGSS